MDSDSTFYLTILCKMLKNVGALDFQTFLPSSHSSLSLQRFSVGYSTDNRNSLQTSNKSITEHGCHNVHFTAECTLPPVLLHLHGPLRTITTLGDGFDNIPYDLCRHSIICGYSLDSRPPPHSRSLHMFSAYHSCAVLHCAHSTLVQAHTRAHTRDQLKQSDTLCDLRNHWRKNVVRKIPKLILNEERT